MSPQRIITGILFVVLVSLMQVRGQDMDPAISKLAEDVAARISENGNKKITVLDFTDLQGGATELGRYVAEQLTVDLVMSKHSFAVLDRANLKRIMDEHQLTASGLIDPENAKRLGKFAGVDAMIFGNIALVGSTVKVVVKIITTDSAEIVGGAKTEFKSDENIQKLLVHAATLETKSNAVAVKNEAPKPPPPPKPKPFGDLQARVESFRLNPGDTRYGFASFSVEIKNTSDTDTYGVAINNSRGNKINLSNGRGEEFYITDLSGIETVFQSSEGFRGYLTDVMPGSAIVITGKGQVMWNGRGGDYRPYRIQAEMVFGKESQGRHPDLKKFNMVLDVR